MIKYVLSLITFLFVIAYNGQLQLAYDNFSIYTALLAFGVISLFVGVLSGSLKETKQSVVKSSNQRHQKDVYKVESSLKLSTKLSLSFVIIWVLLVLTSLVVVMTPGPTKRLANLLGPVVVQEKLHAPELKIENAPLVSYSVALRAAEKKLADIPSLGSQFEIGILTKQKVKDKLVWVGFLEPRSFWVWNSTEGTPGYIVVSATDASDAKLVTELNNKKLNLKFTKEAYFNQDVLRHAYFNGTVTENISSLEPELDDEGNPKWVISTTVPSVFMGGQVVKSVLVVDAQSGKVDKYSLNEVPSWVDRVYPLPIVLSQVYRWGDLVKGRFNWANEDKLERSSYDIVYGDDNQSYFIIGLSSVSKAGEKDTGITGFLTINSRTKETKRYNISGASEEVARKAVENVMPEKRYVASGAIPFMVNGKPTYVMSLSDSSGVIRAYGMVDIENYQLVTVQESFEATYSLHIAKVPSKVTSNVNGEAQPDTLVRIEGPLSRIAQDQKTGVFTFTIAGQPSMYTAAGELSNKLVISQPLDDVIIKVPKGSKSPVSAVFFDNTSITTE